MALSDTTNGLALASSQMPQPNDLDADPLKDTDAGAGTIRRALLRSGRERREVTVDPGTFTLTQESEKTQTEQSLTQEGFKGSQNNVMEEEENSPNTEKVLLGYDAQWCWVESQDDVTFL